MTVSQYMMGDIRHNKLWIGHRIAPAGQGKNTHPSSDWYINLMIINICFLT